MTCDFAPEELGPPWRLSIEREYASWRKRQ